MSTTSVAIASTTYAMSERRRSISARSRVLIWIMVPVSVAVAVVVGITGRVLSARVDTTAKAELAHEGDNLRAFAEGRDPLTGERFTGVDQLLARFVSSNLAESDEAFFSIVNGQPDRRSAGRPPARLDLDSPFVTGAAAAQEPSAGRVSTSGGPAHYAVFPVTVASDQQRGALVVAEFTGPAEAEVWAIVRTLAVVGLVAVAVAGLAGWLVAGRVLAPIRTVRKTAERIGEADLTSRIEVVGHDDVAALAGTFNHMLDRIEQAFTAQHRFLEDAGHELRTPITIVRGQLEVMGDDPVERAQTIEVVVSELTRMSRIIDDLMMLARAERPDFLLLGPVDLAELTVDALAKTKAMASRRWAIDEVADATMWADGQRLTQALVQLASNAVDHTDDDDRIGFGSAVCDDRVRLWVADTGDGIDSELQAQVFERFVRGEGQDRPGSGLGLAIVASIATGHGGRVLLHSETGEGSTFTLDVPLVTAPLGVPEEGAP